MAVTTDIAATYRGPGRVITRLLAMGHREDRALVILMVACGLVFVAQLPRLSREAHLAGTDLAPQMGGALMAWLFVAPLLFYLIAAVSHLVAKLVGGRGDWYGARMALFWSFLASTPLILLHGLVAALVGDGVALQGVGLVWLAVFVWFWMASLWQAERTT
jgi:hypothetical protein